MANRIFQVHIELIGVKPKIWRKLMISSDILLPNFHKIIQTVMGWTNSHLNQFIKNGVFYTEKMEDNWDWEELNNVDYCNIKLSNLLKTVNGKIIYEYDFGDGWMHEIILEEILHKDLYLKYPICLAGERSCPPEDCGGINGYKKMMDIVMNPKHEEYESYIEWLDGEFEPEYFNKTHVNKLLRLEA